MALALGYAAAGFLLGGFSEVLNPLFCALFLFLWYRTRNRYYWAAIVGVIIGTLIVVIAPGNAVRAQLLPPRPDLLTGISRSLKVMGLFLIGEIVNHAPALVLAFLVGYLCPSKTYIRKRLRWIEIIFLVAIGTMAFTLFVPLFFTSGLDSRHFTFASFILVLSIFIGGVLCAGSYRLSSSS